MLHPCIQIYKIGANDLKYGIEPGTCRITGLKSEGLIFEKWVSKTFNDWAYLKPGNIISNEAIFCFDEFSELIRQKTGKENPQRFRTYSHIIHEGKWYCLTKADKEKIFNLICTGAEMVCLSESGQKHLLFKHKPGMWQLEEMFLIPDLDLLKFLHKQMCTLMKLGFSQGEILSGKYNSSRILKAGLKAWDEIEDTLKIHRGTKMMEFTGFMLFIDDDSKQKIQDSYKK